MSPLFFAGLPTSLLPWPSPPSLYQHSHQREGLKAMVSVIAESMKRFSQRPMSWNFVLAVSSVHPPPMARPSPPWGLCLSVTWWWPSDHPVEKYKSQSYCSSHFLFLSVATPRIYSFSLPVLSFLKDKLCQGRDFCLSYSLLCHQHLEQCLAFIRASNMLKG